MVVYCVLVVPEKPSNLRTIKNKNLENITMVTVYWDPPSNTDCTAMVTVYWCERNFDSEKRHTCKVILFMNLKKYYFNGQF